MIEWKVLKGDEEGLVSVSVNVASVLLVCLVRKGSPGVIEMVMEGSKAVNRLPKGQERGSSCEHKALEACLERNGRDLSKCEGELREFKRSCKSSVDVQK